MKKPTKQPQKKQVQGRELDARDLSKIGGGFELHGQYANDVLLNAWWDLQNL
jgi:hypothetical protein